MHDIHKTTEDRLVSDLAIETARRGWKIGIDDVRYWFVTPERAPANDWLEAEGITFIGSTYPDVRDGCVLLDPQGESIAVDCVVTVHRRETSDGVVSPDELLTDGRPAEPVRPAPVAA